MRPNAFGAWAFAAAVLALAFPAAAEDTVSWFGGSVTAQGMAIGTKGLRVQGLAIPDGWTWASTSTLSAGLGIKGEKTRAEASFDLAALGGGSAARAIAGASAPGASFLVAGDPGSAFSLNLRTLWAKIDLDWATLEVGRQVIKYGRGALFSPVDLFAKLDLSGTSIGRLGTDAVRMRLPLDATAGLDAIAAPTADPSKGRYATRLTAFFAGLDSGLLGAWDGSGNRAFAGYDCKFDLGASFYGELLWALEPFAADAISASQTRAAFGLDWSFGDFIVAGEYYLNKGGAVADPNFPGRQYVFGAGAWSYADFARLSLALTADIESTALRITTSLAFDTSQNSGLTVYADLARGSFVEKIPEGLATTLGASLEVKF